MSPLRVALIGLFAAALALAAVMVGLVVISDHETEKELQAVLGPVVGLSYCAAGALASTICVRGFGRSASGNRSGW